jgi:hypothetical protein
MEDWQMRVIDEKFKLDELISRLESTIGSERFKTFKLDQQGLMKEQLGYMRAYSTLLQRRIERF